MTNVCKNEKDVKRHVKNLLDKHQWFWWCPPANGYGKTGISDFHALRDGVFMAIETKFGGNEPTPMQKGFLNSIAANQGFAFVCDETRLEHFDSWLAAFDAACKMTGQGQKPEHADGAAMLNAMRELQRGY